MKAIQIAIGGVYTMKVSGRIVPVRVDNISRRSGDFRTVYHCTNTVTGAKCSARSARKFRRAVETVYVVPKEQLKQLYQPKNP